MAVAKINLFPGNYFYFSGGIEKFYRNQVVENGLLVGSGVQMKCATNRSGNTG
jgi:hypothetical protein